jgi:hypothetical protein
MAPLSLTAPSSHEVLEAEHLLLVASGRGDDKVQEAERLLLVASGSVSGKDEGSA